MALNTSENKGTRIHRKDAQDRVTSANQRLVPSTDAARYIGMEGIFLIDFFGETQGKNLKFRMLKANKDLQTVGRKKYKATQRVYFWLAS